MEQGSLYHLLPALGDVNRFHGKRIETGMVHGGGSSHGSRSEILHLFSIEVVVSQVFGKLNHIINGTCWMTGHEIREQVLLLSYGFRDCFEHLPEFFEGLFSRFVHARSYLFNDVLGRNLEVPRNMVATELIETGKGVGIHEIMPNARSDKDFFNTWNLANPS